MLHFHDCWIHTLSVLGHSELRGLLNGPPMLSFFIPLFVSYLLFVSANVCCRPIMIYTVKDTAGPTGEKMQNSYLWLPEGELGVAGR